MGAADAPGAGGRLADGDVLGAGDELVVGVPVGDAVGEAGGDMGADGAAVGAALAGAVAGADMDEVAFTAGDMLGADVAGAEVAGEVVGPDAACPECMAGAWCAEAARAIPPAADAASSPTIIAAIVSGRASRR